MDRSLETPCVHISYSLSFLHSNSTMPRASVFNPKYRLCSLSSNKFLPGHAGMSLQTSSTISAAQLSTQYFTRFSMYRELTSKNLTLVLFGYGICCVFALHLQHHLQNVNETIGINDNFRRILVHHLKV